MVMEHLDGEEFAVLLERRKKIPPAEAIQYALQITDALIEAHALGIIHRDVKPANLFLAKTRGRAPTLKVLDFGVSKVEHNDRRRTETKEILGSPWYMAPEQLKSASSADPRSDIWSLGVILYELVTGEVPFDGDSMTEVIVKVLHDPLPLGKLPRPLEPVIRRCLAKAPQARFASMEEVAAALRVLASGAPLSSTPTRTSSPPPRALPRHPPSSEILLAADEVELVDPPPDPVDADDDGALVDDAELLWSQPPAAVAPDEAETPFAPPIAPNTPIAAAVATATPSPPPPRPDRPEVPRSPPPDPERPRSRWPTFLLIGGALAVAAIAMRALAPPPKPEPRPEPRPQASGLAPRAPDENEAAAPAPPEVVAAVEAGFVIDATMVTLVDTRSKEAPPSPRSAQPEADAAPPPEDDATLAFGAVRRHQSALKETCWETSAKTTAMVSVVASVDASGAVTGASAASADPQLARCVEGQVKTWTFPASGKDRSLTIPIRFRR
jgi:serine/threonine protein kinase